MARITVHPAHVDGAPRRWTLSEHIVAENLASDHYVTQLLERLSWATADAEALESQSAGLAADHNGDARHAQYTTPSHGADASPRSGSHPIPAGRPVRA